MVVFLGENPSVLQYTDTRADEATWAGRSREGAELKGVATGYDHGRWVVIFLPPLV